MLASNTGTRILRYRDFHTGYKQINMKPEELLVSIRLPRPVEPRQQQFRKVGTRRAQAIAKVSLAAVAQVKNGLVRNIALAFGSVAPYPLHCERTENLLAGKQLTPDRIAEAVALLESEIWPISDIRSTSDYRLRVSRNLLREFLESLA
jgi:CO/xanthine dehydrogenase FAD-binding subunit